MEFEVVTYVPINLDAIEPSELNKQERNYLNQYHQLVYKTISPFLTTEESEWLKLYTREI